MTDVQQSLQLQTSLLSDCVVFDVSTSNENNYLRQQEKDKIDELKSWIECQENIDIYQFAAIRFGTKQWSFLDIYRIMAIFLLQEWAIMFIIQYDAEILKPENKQYTKNWCDRNGDYRYKQLSTMFSILISFTFYNEILNLRIRGLYSWGTNQLCFISKLWISQGLILNLVVILTAWFASIIILYLSNDAVDMVLNSLALYFIVEIDDQAVYFNDFKKIQYWIDVHYDDFVDECFEKMQKGKTSKKCFDSMIKFVHFIADRKYNRFFLLPFAFIAPVFMAICY